MAASHPTYDDLIKMVGFKSSARSDLDATTKPTAEEAAAWLTDGTYEILRLADPLLIPEMISLPTSLTFVTHVDTGLYVADLPSDYLKMVSVYDTTGEFIYIDPRQFAVVPSDTYAYASSQSKVYTLMENRIVVGDPTIVSDPRIIYVKVLASDIVDGSSAIWPLSLDFVPLVVDYAVIQSKIQESEYEQYHYYMQWWYKKLQAMNANAIPVKEKGEKNE